MSDQNAIKIVVDTNLWVGFLLGKRLSSLKDALLDSKVIIYFSEELNGEILKVLKYPRISKFIPENDFFELISHFKDKIQFISTNCIFNDCRDPKDNFLLNLAVSARADYIVTGDLDLLDMKSFRGIGIIRADELEKILSEKKTKNIK